MYKRYTQNNVSHCEKAAGCECRAQLPSVTQKENDGAPLSTPEKHHQLQTK